MDREEIYAEMERELGLVPEWARRIPAAQLEGFWKQTRDFEMAETQLSGKVKDLIGVAVAAAIPCDYCVYWHKTGARGHGASEDEIEEAIGMASGVRMGSTLLNGVAPDMASFRREVDTLAEHAQAHAASTASTGRP